MPPKKSKKNLEKEKQKIVEDKTFGLKNKNKSKKVQKYVDTVKKQAQQKVDGPKKRSSSSAGSSSTMSSAQQALMAARLAELNMMSQPVKDKAKKLSPEEAERIRLEEEAEAERIRIANLPVEDQIEEERAKLDIKTPVTLELFLEWKKRKAKEREEKLAVERAAAQKGLSKAERARGQGLTGRELFEMHENLFVDDEEANTEKLQASGDYTSDSDGAEEGDSLGSPMKAGVQSIEADESLFSAEKAVDVGDESLFS